MLLHNNDILSLILKTMHKHYFKLSQDHNCTVSVPVWYKYPKHEQRVFYQIQKTRAQLECFISDKVCFPQANFFARSKFFIVKIEIHLLKI
jgi:hypothetical protein